MRVWVAFAIVILLCSCSQNLSTKKGVIMKENSFEEVEQFKISSPHFEHMDKIPKIFTCQGEDVNPLLIFQNSPEGTKSIALIVDDPDAPNGDWVHWLIWNIDPVLTRIEKNSIPPGAVQGTNSWGRQDYGGPCPPKGEHRYFFKAYALDTKLDLEPIAKKQDLLDAMQGHLLAVSELIGLYEKS